MSAGVPSRPASKGRGTDTRQERPTPRKGDRPTPRIKLTEAQWQRLVIDTAHAYGWRVAHFRAAAVVGRGGVVKHRTPVDADGVGFPDLVLAHRVWRVRIFAELKSDTGTVKPAQREWIADLEPDPADRWTLVEVWRPSDEARVRGLLSGRAGWT